MNRKLHNTVTALAATTGLLVLSLMAAAPVAPMEAARLAPAMAAASAPTTDAQIERIVGAAAQAATLAAIAAAFAKADKEVSIDATTPDPATAPRKHLARGRQSVAMPFFSFAPRG
jgi:polyisoprenoid-binding protein YceI